MADAQSWTIEQLSGSKEKIVLTGANAPHGRPRQKPVVADGIRIRQKTNYYPDSTSVPTRHIFGYKHLDWQLTGRFSDKHLGKDGAKEVVRRLQLMVAEGQPVRITWRNILSYTGLLEEFVPSREAEHTIAWTLNILIDDNPDIHKPVEFTPIREFQDINTELQAAFETWIAFPQSVPNLQNIMKPSLFDTLEVLSTYVTAPLGAVNALAGQFKSFADMLKGDLNRLDASVNQLRTATLTFQAAIDTTFFDDITITRNSYSDITYSNFKAQSDVNTDIILALLADLNRQVELSQIGRATTGYTAILGDTWEGISTKTSGSADKADVIRQANGIKYGEKPVPGKQYQIPINL